MCFVVKTKFKGDTVKNIDLENDLLNDEDFENFSSQYTDCYVYELFIKETGEIFHVGYYSDEDNDEPLDSGASSPDTMEQLMTPYYETEKRILRTGLTEAKADYFTRKRINEVEKNNMLLMGDNIKYPGYEVCQVGSSPKIYVNPFERHYFGKENRDYDDVDVSSLKTVYLDTGYMSYDEPITALFGNRYPEYYNQLVGKLENIGAKIVKNKFSKAITAWIYMAQIVMPTYEKEQNRALAKLGRNVPTYHIFDVLDALKEVSVSNMSNAELLNVEIHPIHNRCPWQNIKNLYNESAGYRDGHHFWETGEKLRLQGDITEAILLFDKARENGYDAPVLYESYEKAYRKIKDYDNEIAILMERYERIKELHGISQAFDVEMKEKIDKAKKRLIQSRNKRLILQQIHLTNS